MIKVNNQVISPHFFPDGTFNLTDLGSMFSDMEDGKRYIRGNSFQVEWRWESPNEYMLLYFITNHLREKCGSCLMHLYMPYIPDARMDRVKHPYQELFTLKYFAKFINSLSYNKVHVLDPHSNVSAALIDNIVIHEPTEFVRQVVNEHNIDLLCFPDEGAMKRYSDNCNFRPFIYGEKKRDWKTGQIQGIMVHNPMNIEIEDMHILIVDDICSKGGTFYYMGKALREYNPGQVDLFVSHCENSIFDGKLLANASDSNINEIYTTDSLQRDISPRIHTMKVFNQEVK